MKIAYLSRGNSVYDRRFLEKMVERGYEPYFISYHPSQRVEVEGVKTFHYNYLTMHAFGRFLSLQTALHLRKLLQRIQPDVLHSGWVPEHGFFGALSGFHPTLSMPWGSDILVEPDLSLSLKWRSRFTLRRADMIACDCELVKKKVIELSGYPPERIFIFPWGTDLNIFRPLNRPSGVREKLGWEDKKILIMNRNFRPVYGIEYFIEALPMVIKARPETRVIMAGEGPTLPECKQHVANLGLNDYICFAGFLADREMAEYLNASDIYVTTSLSDGASCSMLEAMACGLAVVVSDAPAYIEWVEDCVNGYIAPRRDPVTLAERLVHLLDDPGLRHEMGRRNREIAHERADWEKNFDRLENIYQDLARQRSR